jgi:N-acetylglutamate synthase-like GNAT family acetyltransferase
MTVIRTGYQLVYEPISACAAMGSAAVIPWDSAIFGFPVASFRTASEDLNQDHLDAFRDAFTAWMRTKNISVCSSTLSPTQSGWRQVLPQVGFEFVDLSLQVGMPLSGAKLPPVRSQLRPAEPADHGAIEAIAAESFSHGRYHADPRFPRSLADRRYSHWVRNALTAPSEIDRVYVLEESGKVAGFYHVTIEGDVSDLRLAALSPESKATMLGVELYAAMLHELRRQGIRRAVASISAVNTSVMNLFSMLGFRFSDPVLNYHWHSSRRERALEKETRP